MVSIESLIYVPVIVMIVELTLYIFNALYVHLVVVFFAYCEFGVSCA
mgnify:CR=1 FL=1